ncbi:hypothetical protein [Solidesulfovibrio alcoholivorans]|uniref:hypothetical protein n=1 Tax=Solidesulfovibrio alcoholivorans TaxID=81406 RepID=UPI000AFFDDBA|nr:hypothetical protein [Solidesulfovibrio alcoholivorans]
MQKQIKYAFLIVLFVFTNIVHANNTIQFSKITNISNFSILPAVGVGQDGSIYVCETGQSVQQIQKFSSTGSLITTWGGYGHGNGQFQIPNGVAFDLTGNVLISEFYNSRFQKFDTSGGFVQAYGTYGSSDGQFINITGITTDGSGNIYVADSGNYRIQKFNASGVFLTKWSSYGVGPDQSNYSPSIAADSSGNVYISEPSNYRITKYSSTGSFLARWGSYGTGNGQFNYISGLAIDSTGNVFVSDKNNNTVQKFSSLGIFLDKWDITNPEDNSSLRPDAIATDTSGNLIITNNANDLLIKGTINFTGSLQVSIQPQGAISAGAQWNVDNGSWQNSGTTLSNIATGTHTVYFKTTDGWTAPQNQSVTISANQTTDSTGTYIQQTYTGSLQVNILPQSAVTAGAQWNLDNGSWQNSGTTLSNITTGANTVYFKITNGWTAPQNQSVTILANQTSTINANYTSTQGRNLSSVVNLLLNQ